MKRERSAGVILYRMDGGKKLYLILRYAARHWDFAKGKKEDGETDMQTALREVREETGITDVAVYGGFEKEIEYDFIHEGITIHKTVVFFLGETCTADVTLSDEHMGYAWEEYDDAIMIVTHAAARGVLSDADSALKV